MLTQMLRIVLFFSLFLLATPALQAESSGHFKAYTEGRYAEARTLALQDPTADRYAFSARSLLAEAISMSDFAPAKTLLLDAKKHAEQALALEASHTEARLQLAIALSLEARTLGLREAWRSGHVRRAQRLALEVIEDDPQNAYAHGFLAVWHLEVRRRGGRFGASMMGASVKQARRHYHAARALRPNDAGLHWQFARSLAALDTARYKTEIETALTASQKSLAETALDRLMQERAVLLQGMMLNEPLKYAERQAGKML